MASLPPQIAAALYRAAVVAVGEGSLFERLSELESMQWDLPERLRQRAETELRDILVHARRTSSFYETRIPELAGDGIAALLTEIPLLEKSDLQEHADEIRSREASGRVSRKTTGGSTGEPVTVLKDRRATAYERAAMWLAYGWFDVRMGDRCARFWGTPYTWKRRLRTRVADFFMNRIRFSAFEFEEESLDGYWDRLVHFQPDYVHGYVSMLEQMARHRLREDRRVDSLDVKSVIATSEVLTPPQRSAIESAFGAPVQVEYGCGEVGPIAHECPQGKLHLMVPNLWIELLRPDGTPARRGESGEIVVTDLHNRAMPLIRYRVGDHGVRGADCRCGRTFPVLEKVWGRAYDFVEGPDGRRYHGEFFMYVFEDLRSSGTPIQQFQVIQKNPDDVRILLKSEAAISEATRTAVVDTVSRRLPGIRVEVRSVPEIPREPSGKMRVIRREYPSGSEDERG